MSLPAPIIERHGRIDVVRDDQLPGGTKTRAILPLMQRSGAREFVYASPAYGYAQIALAHSARLTGKAATVFTAQRKQPHPLTRTAHAAGARIMMVPNGYLNVVQARAKRYAQQVGAYLVPFGVDTEEAVQAITAVAIGMNIHPPEVWTVSGSGVLTRALQRAWPLARFMTVVIGKADTDTGRARRYVSPYRFDHECKPAERPPFPSSPWYDAKAWAFISRHASPGALFWNVGR